MNHSHSAYHFKKRWLAATAIAAVVLVALTGCFNVFPQQQFQGPVSTPTHEDIDKSLEKYYWQTLKWSNCQDGFGCATAIAPIDWEDPSKGDIELSLVRHIATGQRLGSLLVNPGGPGGSGYDFVRNSLQSAVGPALQKNFDIVGFDPRGVGRSTAVKCVDSKGLDAYLYDIIPAQRGTAQWISDVQQQTKAFGDACAKNTGELLAHVDTRSAARDLDMLRAALGDKKLNYLGYSYGTYLGATYADIFPEHVGRLVLDGAIDPSISDFEVSKGQAVGFEGQLRAYLADCLTGTKCPFEGPVDNAMTEVSKLIASIDNSPMQTTSGRILGGDTFVTAIIFPLYSTEGWSALTDMFTSTIHGDADTAIRFADAYNARDADGKYADNSAEAFQAINCLDYSYQSDPAVMRERAEQITAAAPVIGPYMGYNDLSCDTWPYKSSTPRGSIHASGADPILVIGTTGDPATPYQWAVSLAQQLNQATLITYKGNGHTAYNHSNSCVNNKVEDYFIKGTVPATDTSC